MVTCLINNLQTKNFNFENIRFERLTPDIEMEERWSKELNATFKATADNDLDVRPIIRNNGLIGVVQDICLLLSLALSSHVYCSRCITTNEYIIIGGVLHVSDVRGKNMVQFNKIEPFLNTATQSLREPEWAEKTGFVPSVYFLQAANYSEPDDVAFMLTWIALEILANAYASEQGVSSILPEDKFNEIVKPAISRALSEINKENLPEKEKVLIKGKVSELNRPSIRNKVHKLRDKYRWDFITDELFGDCNRLRNDLMHLGTYAGFNQIRLTDLSIRLRDALQLALIDLLGCSKYVPNLQGLKKQIERGSSEE